MDFIVLTFHFSHAQQVIRIYIYICSTNRMCHFCMTLQKGNFQVVTKPKLIYISFSAVKHTRNYVLENYIIINLWHQIYWLSFPLSIIISVNVTYLQKMQIFDTIPYIFFIWAVFVCFSLYAFNKLSAGFFSRKS